MSEHLASDRLTADEKVDVYRAFFERCAAWLDDEGQMGLQLICLDNVGHEGSRPHRGASSELIRVDIFPESMPASLSELVLGWETHFELVRFLDHSDHYRRTFRAWGLAYRTQLERARTLVGDATARTFARYFAAGEAFFRLREDALYRVILKKRPKPKAWVRLIQPSDLHASGGRRRSPDGRICRRGAVALRRVEQLLRAVARPGVHVFVRVVVVRCGRSERPRRRGAAEGRLLREPCRAPRQ
jgi:hypothetical protein